MDKELRRIRGIASYQFGVGVGEALFPDDIEIEYSRRTGKIRFVYTGGALLAVLRPTDGMFTLSIAGAERLTAENVAQGFTVTVIDDVSEVIAEGKNVMAKHVVDAGGSIHPGDEVIVVDSQSTVLAVGKALLTRDEMHAFSYGVAVRTRRGRNRNR
jgi:predicted RNA-binding protein (TIGR00451 family)